MKQVDSPREARRSPSPSRTSAARPVSPSGGRLEWGLSTVPDLVGDDMMARCTSSSEQTSSSVNVESAADCGGSDGSTRSGRLHLLLEELNEVVLVDRCGVLIDR